jgi:hypothetical protein
MGVWNERLVAAARGRSGRDRTKIRAKGGGRWTNPGPRSGTVRVIDEIFTRNAGWRLDEIGGC